MQVLCTVYDEKAEYFIRVFAVATVAEAKRQFEDAVQDRESIMYRHPKDFTLYHVGDFDDDSGQLVQVDRKMLINGAEVMRAEFAEQQELAMFQKGNENG